MTSLARVDEWLRVLASKSAASKSHVDTLEQVLQRRRARESTQIARGGAGEASYDFRECRLGNYVDPAHRDVKYVPLFQLLPLPSSLRPGGPTLFMFGGMGRGSCFYDSLCFLLNVNGYTQYALQHDQEKLIEIAGAFRCSFARNLSSSTFRRFLDLESAATPQSNSWRGVARERREDDERAIRDDFCTYETWATETTARYLARALHLTIYVIDVDEGRAFCGVHGVNEEDPVALIAWEQKNHFNPIVQIQSVGGSDGDHQTLNMVGIFTDAATKRQIRHIYDTVWCHCDRTNSPCARPAGVEQAEAAIVRAAEQVQEAREQSSSKQSSRRRRRRSRRRGV